MIPAAWTWLPERALLPRFLGGLDLGADIPLRLMLWNGRQYDLGSPVRVTVRLPSPAALRYFLAPRLDRLAEGYVQGHFDVIGNAHDIVQVAARIAQTQRAARPRFTHALTPVLHNRTLDAQSIAHHYDVSNEFYAQWLDPRMVYSCAYFSNGQETLEQAQLAKLDHILHKLMLRPGEHLLDIGCGWGALVMRAAQRYGVRAVGITLSEKQYTLARQRVAEAGLENQVEIRLQDYRDLDPGDMQFDKISSVGMFEHVGLRHLVEYFGKIHGLLRDGGLVLNHGITSTDPQSASAPLGAANFIDKYVFPNGELPHISLALQSMQTAGLEVLDVECLRRHYQRTLQMWADRFEERADVLREMVDETTYRVWRIYLAGCAQAFAMNWVSVHQILACKSGTDVQLNPTPWSRAYMYAAPLNPPAPAAHSPQ